MFDNIISTKFFPISWTSPLTVAKIIVPFLILLSCSKYGFNISIAIFIVSADDNTKGNKILPDPNRSPTSFIAGSKKLLIMSKAVYLLSNLWIIDSMFLWSPLIIFCFISSSSLSVVVFSNVVSFSVEKYVINWVKLSLSPYISFKHIFLFSSSIS